MIDRWVLACDMMSYDCHYDWRMSTVIWCPYYDCHCDCPHDWQVSTDMMSILWLSLWLSPWLTNEHCDMMSILWLSLWFVPIIDRWALPVTWLAWASWQKGHCLHWFNTWPPYPSNSATSAAKPWFPASLSKKWVGISCVSEYHMLIGNQWYNNNNNKEDFWSTHLPHKVAAQGALQ